MSELSLISLQLITFTCPWGSGYFQVNELYTRKLEELPPAYTLLMQCYSVKITMFQSTVFGSVCIDDYIVKPGRLLFLNFSNFTLNALIITIDDIFCNNFPHFWFKKTDLNQMKLIENKIFFF